MSEQPLANETDSPDQPAIDPANVASTQEQTGTNWDNVFSLVENYQLPSDAGMRAAAIHSWRAEDFVAATAALHSLLAPGVDTAPATKAIKIVSPTGEVKKELTHPSETLAIFEKASELLQQLYVIRNHEETQAFLDRAANVIAMSIVLAHSFEDGNGRTARVMAHIIKLGYDNSDKIKDDIQKLGSNRPEKGYRINSYLPRGEAVHKTPSEVLDATAALGIPLSEDAQYKDRSWETFSSPYL